MLIHILDISFILMKNCIYDFGRNEKKDKTGLHFNLLHNLFICLFLTLWYMIRTKAQLRTQRWTDGT